MGRHLLSTSAVLLSTAVLATPALAMGTLGGVANPFCEVAPALATHRSLSNLTTLLRGKEVLVTSSFNAAQPNTLYALNFALDDFVMEELKRAGATPQLQVFWGSHYWQQGRLPLEFEPTDELLQELREAQAKRRAAKVAVTLQFKVVLDNVRAKASLVDLATKKTLKVFEFSWVETVPMQRMLVEGTHISRGQLYCAPLNRAVPR